MDNVCNCDCAGGESRAGISLSISSLMLKWLFIFCSFTETVECADVVPKYRFI